MSQTPVESLIAHCLMDPKHLQRLLTRPDGWMSRPDLKRLRLFGGFISKVQHNDLWDDFPATREWLHRVGIELRVFADYRKLYLELGHKKRSREQKIRDFTSYIENRFQGSRHRELRDLVEIVRHERSLWQTSNPMPSTVACDLEICTDFAHTSWKAFSRLVPHFQGRFQICRFQADPMGLISLLNTKKGRRRRMRRRDAAIYLGYWTALGGRSCVLDLVPHEASILSEVNGKRSVRTVIVRARCRGLGMVAPSQFRSFFSTASEAGLMTLYNRGMVA